MRVTQHQVTPSQARGAVKTALRARGIRPTKASYAWLVECSAIPIPDWAREHAVKGLPVSPGRVWLRRRDAWMLAAIDRGSLGRPTRLRFEYRVCGVCKRVLIGELAKQYRMRLESESNYPGERLPCDADCTARQWRNKGRKGRAA